VDLVELARRYEMPPWRLRVRLRYWRDRGKVVIEDGVVRLVG
jgi:hypothetical protein